MNPRGGIDAIELVSGGLAWTTMRAAKPISLAGNLLIAQAETLLHRKNTLRLVGLDVLNDGKLAYRANVKFPAGVDVSIDDGLASSFRTDAWIDGKFAVIAWTFSQGYVGGPPPEDISVLVRKVTGTVQIDPIKGQANLLELGEPVPRPVPEIPDTIARQAGSGALVGSLWTTGKVFATTKRVPADHKQGVALVRWSCATGETLPDVKLFGADYRLRYPSVDQTHLLASKADHTSQPPWRWLIFSIDSGARVGTVNMESPGARFFIWRDQLVFASPLQRRLVAGKWLYEAIRLRTIDLETGEERWSWPIRDTAYRGPYPPQRTGSGNALPTPTPE